MGMSGARLLLGAPKTKLNTVFTTKQIHHNSHNPQPTLLLAADTPKTTATKAKPNRSQGVIFITVAVRSDSGPYHNNKLNQPQLNKLDRIPFKNLNRRNSRVLCLAIPT